MPPATRQLLAALAAFAAMLVVCDRVLAAYAGPRFLPSKRLEAARAAGSGCVALAGDSRMQAGFDAEAFRRALQARGLEVCVNDLSLGAVGLPGQAVALRELLTRGVRPRLLVVGSVPEALLRAEPEDPGAWIGNQSLLVLWGRSSDAALHMPAGGNPVEGWDRRLRFALYRSSALGSLRSLLWARVQAAQDRLTGAAVRPRNTFGAVADMQALARSFWAGTHHAYQRYATAGRWEWSPWLGVLEGLAAREGIALVHVELPMPATYRDALRAEPLAPALRAALRARLGDSGVVDLSGAAWLDDAHFPDGLHLGAQGARLLSADLAAALAGHLGPVARPSPHLSPAPPPPGR